MSVGINIAVLAIILTFLSGCADTSKLMIKNSDLDQVELNEKHVIKQNLLSSDVSSHQKDRQQYAIDALAKRANDLVNQNRLIEAAALLDQAKMETWAIASVRGDLAAKQKNWEKASSYYDEAACLLGCFAPHKQNNEIEEYCKDISLSSSEAKLIYGVLETTASSSCVRGTVVVPAIIPVKFGYNQSILNQDGIQSINSLLDIIKARQELKNITLIGHTDDRGTDAFNLNLSQKRAETVAKYLINHGIKFTITPIGKGKSNPPVISDPSKYSQEEIWAIQRRVELKFD